MSDGDYRALLLHLTGKDSSKAMTQAERARVRERLQHLARRMGLERVDQRPAYKSGASPLERKVWSLWYDLGARGKLEHAGPQGLRAWVKRQYGLDHVRFCSRQQLHDMVEAMKLWGAR